MSQQINLFNPAFLPQKKLFTAMRMGQALVVLLCGALAVGLVARDSVAQLQQEADRGAVRLAQLEQRLVRVKTEMAPRPNDAALAGEIDQANTRLQALRGVEAILSRGELGNTVGFGEHFKALARQHRDGLWLTAVAVGAGGLDLRMRGRALEAPMVPAFIARLGSEDVMRGKAFGSLKIGQPAPAKDGAAPGFVEFDLDSTAPESAK